MNDNTVIGYLMEAHLMECLQQISTNLHGGTDRERDYGHRLWLIINELRNNPITEGESNALG